MSENATEIKTPLSGENPKPQQPSATQELTEQERFNDIKKRWEESDKSDLKNRNAVIAALKDITPKVQPNGALHLETESSSTAH